MLKHICGFVTRDIDANTHETAEILGLKAMDGPFRSAARCQEWSLGTRFSLRSLKLIVLKGRAVAEQDIETMVAFLTR